VPYITAPCENWGSMINGSQKSFGVTIAGEFSLGFNDCKSPFLCEPLGMLLTPL
jgi:hypothetical protein